MNFLNAAIRSVCSRAAPAAWLLKIPAWRGLLPSVQPIASSGKGYCTSARPRARAPHDHRGDFADERSHMVRRDFQRGPKAADGFRLFGVVPNGAGLVCGLADGAEVIVGGGKLAIGGAGQA